MVRRSTPQRIVDDRAFPVRIKVRTQGTCLGALASETVYWLQDNLPRGDFATHSTGDRTNLDASSFYFRRVEDAQRFLDAFPALILADRTLLDYTSPALPSGRKPD